MTLNKPSLSNKHLNGTYCSLYNHGVKTKGLSFGVFGCEIMKYITPTTNNQHIPT
jgi:hypothetical protein